MTAASEVAIHYLKGQTIGVIYCTESVSRVKSTPIRY